MKGNDVRLINVNIDVNVIVLVIVVLVVIYTVGTIFCYKKF